MHQGKHLSGGRDLPVTANGELRAQLDVTVMLAGNLEGDVVAGFVVGARCHNQKIITGFAGGQGERRPYRITGCNMESAPQPRGSTDKFVLLDVPTLTTLARGSCATRKREPNLRGLTLFSFRAGQQAPPPKLGGRVFKTPSRCDRPCATQRAMPYVEKIKLLGARDKIL